MLPQFEKWFSGHLGQRHETPACLCGSARRQVRQKHAFPRQNVDVRMPMDQIFPPSRDLNRPNHSGHTLGASAHRLVNRAERPAGRLTKLSQQRAIVAKVDPQSFGNCEHELSVGYLGAYLLGHPPSPRLRRAGPDGLLQRPFLVANLRQGFGRQAARADAPASTRKRHEQLVPTLRAPNPRKPLLQIATVQQPLHGLGDDPPAPRLRWAGRSPKTIALPVALFIDPLELRIEQSNQLPAGAEVGLLRSDNTEPPPGRRTRRKFIRSRKATPTGDEPCVRQSQVFPPWNGDSPGISVG